jgi:hypothetical protein
MELKYWNRLFFIKKTQKSIDAFQLDTYYPHHLISTTYQVQAKACLSSFIDERP